MRQTKQRRSTVEVRLTDEKPTTKIDFVMSDGSARSLSCTAADLSALTTALGTARARMVSGTVVPSLRGVRVSPVYNPHWLVQHEPSPGGAALFFQHPAFGPVAFIIPGHEIHALTAALASHEDVQIPNAPPGVNQVIN
jgi:hypothetical protein